MMINMGLTKPHFVFHMMFIVFAFAPGAYVLAEERDEVVIAFRIAADPVKHASLADQAADRDTVTIDATREARWILMPEHTVGSLTESELITRPDPAGTNRRQVLIIFGPDDVEISRARAWRTGMDQYAKPSIDLALTPEDGERMRLLTTENIGNRLAIIHEDQLINAHVIMSSVAANLRISGFETEAQLLPVLHALQGDIQPEPMHWLDILLFTLIFLIVFSGFLYLIVMGLWPTRGYKPPKPSKLWAVGAGLIGFMIGAQRFGYSRHYGRGNGYLEDVVTIDLSFGLLGGIVFAAIGIVLVWFGRWFLLRAWHNTLRLAGRVSSGSLARQA